MKLLGRTKKDSSEKYRLYLQGEYERLRKQKGSDGAASGFEEVKLRLFLSLLDRPNGEDDIFEKRAVNE